LTVAVLIVLGLVALERWRPWRADTDRNDPTASAGSGNVRTRPAAVPAE
jgi:hypothetical protein